VEVGYAYRAIDAANDNPSASARHLPLHRGGFTAQPLSLSQVAEGYASCAVESQIDGQPPGA